MGSGDPIGCGDIMGGDHMGCNGSTGFDDPTGCDDRMGCDDPVACGPVKPVAAPTPWTATIGPAGCGHGLRRSHGLPGETPAKLREAQTKCGSDGSVFA